MKHFLFLILTLSISFTSCSDDDGIQNSVNNGGGNNSSGCSGGPSTVTDIDGNVYNVVQIGNQCWMKENLRTSKYRDGSIIPNNPNDSVWWHTTNGAMADPDSNSANVPVYGKLYNGYAIVDSRGLCPSGWDVSTDFEWLQMLSFLDPLSDTSQLEANMCPSYVAGAYLNNLSSFRTLPSGNRGQFGGVSGFGEVANFYTTSTYHPSEPSPSGGQPLFGYVIHPDDPGITHDVIVSRFMSHKNAGFSVRCVRD